MKVVKRFAFLFLVGLFLLFPEHQAAASRTSMYQAYASSVTDVFFTIDPNQYNIALSNGFVSQGTPFYVENTQIAGTLPIQRFYSAFATDHFYTVLQADVNYVLSAGWVYERVEGYMYPPNIAQPFGTVSLYRLNWVNGLGDVAHVFTTSTVILAQYQSGGWQSDGVVGYVWPSNSPLWDAKVVAQNIPSFFEFGVPTAVSVTMQNTSSSAWGVGDFFLVTESPQDNKYWCIQNTGNNSRVPIPNSVAPGQQVVFNFVMKPNFCIGIYYPLQFQMTSPIYGTFGQTTVSMEPVVASASAQSIQAIPVVSAGNTVPVVVHMINATTDTWPAGGLFRLGSANPYDNWTWGLSRVSLTSAVGPGQIATFVFNVTAPQTLGTYNMQWQVVHEGVAWLGQMTPPYTVQVISAPEGRGMLPPGLPPLIDPPDPQRSICEMFFDQGLRGCQ